MFFRRGNTIRVDFVEAGKEDRVTVLKEFNAQGIVVGESLESEDETFIPYTSVSEIRLVTQTLQGGKALNTQSE